MKKTQLTVHALKDTNPKTRYGQSKPPLHLLPTPALLHMAEALRDGSIKYGMLNWRTDPVSASTYYAACLRHLTQYWDGEDIDPVSLVSHLGHAATNIAILLDAIECGMLIDDRPPAGPTARLIRDKFTKPLEKASSNVRRYAAHQKQSRGADVERGSKGTRSRSRKPRRKAIRKSRR